MTEMKSSLWIDARKRFLKNKMAVLGLIVILFFILLAIFANIIIPYDYAEAIHLPIAEPSSSHWLGTDELGRDVLSRLIYGARISMSVGLISQLIVLVIGTTLGCLAGYYGGKTDNLIMRFTDIMFAFPTLLLALLIMTVFGRSITNLFIALGIVGWPATARLVRGQVLSIRKLEYVQAAYALGASSVRIMFRHLIPNLLGPLIVNITFGIPRAIMEEAFLSFIGIGAPPPIPSWGLMISEGFRWIRVKPYLTIFPILAISIVLLAFNFVGDGLRDALDPKMKNK